MGLLQGRCYNCKKKAGQLWLDLHRGLCGPCWKRWKNQS